MKKSIWLAIIGAAALTGCQSEVMQQREYVPAPREDVEPAKQTPETYTTTPQTTEVEPVRTRQETAPAPQEYQPMNNTFTNKGVDDDAPMLDNKGGKKGGKKGAKQAEKGGKTAGPGEYIVKSGDTPEKIARKHRVRLKDLMAANNLTEESAKKLRVGQKLVIPARTAKSGKSGKRAAGAQVAGPGEYIVQSGDSPERIARKNHVRLKDLMAANNLDEESAKKLKIGQKLVIPAKGAAKGDAPVKSEAGKSTPRRSGGKESAPRQPGLKREPVDGGYAVEVPRDMTVAEFSKLAGVSEEQLRELNPDMPEDRVRKDSIYIVPKN